MIVCSAILYYIIPIWLLVGVPEQAHEGPHAGRGVLLHLPQRLSDKSLSDKSR